MASNDRKGSDKNGTKKHIGAHMSDNEGFTDPRKTRRISGKKIRQSQRYAANKKGTKSKVLQSHSQTAETSFTSPTKYDALGDNEENENSWKCQVCRFQYSDQSDRLMECQRCVMHFCLECLGKTDDEYDILTQSDSMWFCSECRVKVEKDIITDREIETRCAEITKKFENRIIDMEVRLALKLEKEDVNSMIDNAIRINQVSEVTIRDIIRDEMSKVHETNEGSEEQVPKVSFRDIVREELEKLPKPEIKSTATGASGKTEETPTMSKIMHELSDSQDRENNAVFHGVPESKSERKEDKLKNDLEYIQKVTAHCGVELNSDAVIKTLRIGRPKPNFDRPLIVTLEPLEKKIEIFRNLGKMKNAPEDIKGIGVSHDMTESQRADNKQKVTEAKQKEQEANGEFIFRVRGPPWDRRVVRLKPRPAQN